MMLFSLIRFIKQYPEPLSVIVRPSASFVLAISISFGRPIKKQYINRRSTNMNYLIL